MKSDRFEQATNRHADHETRLSAKNILAYNGGFISNIIRNNLSTMDSMLVQLERVNCILLAIEC